MESIVASASSSTPSRRGRGGARGTPDRNQTMSNAKGSGRYKEKFNTLREQFDAVNTKKEQTLRELSALEDKERKMQTEIDLLIDALATAAPSQPLLVHIYEQDDPHDLSFLAQAQARPEPIRHEPPRVSDQEAFNEYFARNERGILPRAHQHVTVNNVKVNGHRS